MLNKIKLTISSIAVSVLVFNAQAQNTRLDGSKVNTIVTAVPFLNITPDARRGGLGDAGVASSPDANSAYWNPGALSFIDKDYGVSVSNTPWLTRLGIRDMYISNLSGFYKLRKVDAVSLSMTYFAMGTLSFTDNFGVKQIDFNPNEIAINGTYSRTLTENLGLGVSTKFVYSNLAGSFSNQTGVQGRPARTAAVDVGTYYKKEIAVSGNPSEIAFGAVISNFGPQVSYSDNNRRDFIPTNLRVGTAFTTEIDQYNKVTFLLDANKLMVPTPGPKADSTLLGGFFQSMYYAPGGSSEKLQEVQIGAGVEYWYDNTFAVRGGYFHENENKGNRKYFTFGFGVRYQRMGFDFAYLAARQSNHPLNNTLRFSLLFLFEKPAAGEPAPTVN